MTRATNRTRMTKANIQANAAGLTGGGGWGGRDQSRDEDESQRDASEQRAAVDAVAGASCEHERGWGRGRDGDSVGQGTRVRAGGEGLRPPPTSTSRRVAYSRHPSIAGCIISTHHRIAPARHSLTRIRLRHSPEYSPAPFA